jgi:multiple sugar transport system ATP-binding protein
VARLVLQNLSKTYQGARGKSIQALKQLNLTVEGGELLVLVGPSGCGKTTTLRLIAGLDDATSGTISLDGRAINGIAAKDRDVAMVFQNQALYPHMTAYENIAFGLKVRKCSPDEIRKRVAQSAEMLGIEDLLNRKPAELSGGQRQRVALGRALVREPKVFLLDEPLSNLDPITRKQLRREILALHTKVRAPMIYVTHDEREALPLGKRIALMREGELQQVGTAEDLRQRPANQFVAEFFAPD